MMNDTVRFICGDREWIGREYVNEANTRIIFRVVPRIKGRPFPTRVQNGAPPAWRIGNWNWRAPNPIVLTPIIL